MAGYSADMAVWAYIDQRCDDLQRETETLRRDAEIRAGLLEKEIAQRTRGSERRHDQDIAGIKEQANLARLALEHRLEALNEWRAQSNDRQRDFPTRDVLDEVTAGLRAQDAQQEARIRALEERITAAETSESATTQLKTGQRASVTLIVAVITSVLFFVSVAVTIFVTTRGH